MNRERIRLGHKIDQEIKRFTEWAHRVTLGKEFSDGRFADLEERSDKKIEYYALPLYPRGFDITEKDISKPIENISENNSSDKFYEQSQK